MSKHTEGPWRPGGNSYRVGPGNRAEPTPNHAVIGGRDGHIIATVYGIYLGESVAEANARLMATAPELLAQLQKLVAMMDAPSTMIVLDQEDFVEARAVIAKATREATP